MGPLGAAWVLCKLMTILFWPVRTCLTRYHSQVSLENGLVVNFDARALPSDLDSPSPARFTLSAHDGAVSALDINPHVRGVIATGGTDKIVKIWNVADDPDTGKRQVSLVTSRDLGVVSLAYPTVSASRLCMLTELSTN